MKKYSDYKESGVEWLGDIPAHWGIKKLKFLANIQNSNVDKKSYENEKKVRLCNYVDVYKNMYITPKLALMEATANQDEIDKFRVKEGDVLITKDSEEWNDIAIPAYVAEAEKDMICGYHLSQIRPLEHVLDGKYLFMAFLTKELHDQFDISATGVTRYGIPKSAIDNSLFVVPPFTEQKSIASFLDRKISQIDSLISKKKRMIDLLKEERAGIINHAVTKGINPEAEMKDSGVEWLGEVPKHWEISKLKYLSRIRYGLGQPPKLQDTGLPMIRATNVDHGRIVEKDLIFVSPEDVPVERDPYLQEGDIIVVRSGAYTADSAIIPVQYAGAIAGYDMVVTALKVNCHFLSHCLLSQYVQKYQMDLHKLRAAQPHLNAEDLGDIIILVPPQKEQEKIAMYLKNKLANIDLTSAIALKENSLFEEYRTALINETVTGKIDIRDKENV